MPIGPFIGALGAGLGQGEQQGYKDSLQQASDMAFGRTLQMLSQPPPQPPPPVPGTQGIPGVNGQPAPPQPPMGGMPPQGGMPMGGGAPPMPQGGPPMGPPQMGGPMGAPVPQPMGGGPMGQPGNPPPQQMGGGGFDVRQLAQMITTANPGAPPQVLAGAMEQMIKTVLPVQIREQALQQALQLGLLRADVAVRGQDVRAGTAERGQDVRAETAAGAQETARRGQDVRAETQKSAQEGVQGRFNVREARITAHQMITSDQAWQRLDQQRKALQARVQQAGDKQSITQWRAILDAQHKKAQEIIAAYAANSAMPEDKRKQLLKEADEAYDDAIRSMSKGGKESFDSRFKGGGQPTP